MPSGADDRHRREGREDVEVAAREIALNVPPSSEVAHAQDDLDEHQFSGGDNQPIELKEVTCINVPQSVAGLEKAHRAPRVKSELIRQVSGMLELPTRTARLAPIEKPLCRLPGYQAPSEAHQTKPLAPMKPLTLIKVSKASSGLTSHVAEVQIVRRRGIA